MTGAVLGMELRLRARTVLAAALGLICVSLLVGSLFPALGSSIGDLDLPQGVSDLLGGGQFSTIAGWLRTEIASIYGPLVFAGVAITAAAATTAGEEESGILGLVLAHPVPRTTLLLAKAGAVALEVLALTVAAFAGLAGAVLLAGGGIGAGDLAALSIHLGFFGLVSSALAFAPAAAIGRRGLAAGIAAGVTALMFLVNGFAPAVHGLEWLKDLTTFHWYEGADPLTSGVHPADLAVLAAATAALLAVGLAGFARRDLRG